MASPRRTLLGVAVDPKALRRHDYKKLDTEHVRASAKVAENLYWKATGDGRPAVIAAIFWLKTRAGWKETIVHEVHATVSAEPMNADEWASRYALSDGTAAKHGGQCCAPSFVAVDPVCSQFVVRLALEVPSHGLERDGLRKPQQGSSRRIGSVFETEAILKTLSGPGRRRSGDIPADAFSFRMHRKHGPKARQYRRRLGAP